MEFKEFKQFIKELNIKIEGLSTEDLFKKIDVDGSGKIDLEEFIRYYKTLTGGQEFKEIFEMYSQSKDYLTLQEFKKFMLEVQKARDFLITDSLSLFVEYCEGIPKDLKAMLRKKLDDQNFMNKVETEYFLHKYKVFNRALKT